jgi:predicted nucleic acid-binding protein
MPTTPIHLDTNYLIYYAGGGREDVVGHVEAWLREGRPVYVSAMAWAEFQCGPLTVREHDLAHDMIHGVIPITVDTANRAGWLFVRTGRRPRSLADCLIAACAIDAHAALATSNRTDFEPFLAHGLVLVDGVC